MWKKWGEQQKKKFFVNVAETLISFKEVYQYLLRLPVSFGGCCRK